MKTLLLCALLAGVGGAEVEQTIRMVNPSVPEGCRQEGPSLICKDHYMERIEKLEKRVEDLEKATSIPDFPVEKIKVDCTKQFDRSCSQLEK